MAFPDLAARLARVRAELGEIHARLGSTSPVTIVAVTKGHGPEAALAAATAGVPDVGENRVQEALDKQDATIAAELRWHLIGHLQTNKAKHVPGRFAMVHSVDSGKVIDALNRAVGRTGGPENPPLDVLVQVNIAGEDQKSGCDPAEAGDLVARAAATGTLRVRGLMTMAPFTDDESVQRRTFAGLRELRDRVATAEVALPELSMGMSGDWRAAAAEGATILRLGTILFGERT